MHGETMKLLIAADSATSADVLVDAVGTRVRDRQLPAASDRDQRSPKHMKETGSTDDSYF